MKISPPKPIYQSFTYRYPYDEHDYFSYDVLRDENSRNDKAVVIVPFMAGHSKSGCIRRCAQQYFKAGYPVYILQTRGALGKLIDPEQVKFRPEGYDTEDLDTLINKLVKEPKVILNGYSLGSFTTGLFLTNKENNRQKVEKAVLNFLEHKPEVTLKLPQRAQRFLGSSLVQLVRSNEAYYLSHGFTHEELDDVYKVGTTAHFDEVVWCKVYKLENVMDYYARFSLIDKMTNFEIPTLFTNTEDDPIVGKEIPIEHFEKNDNISFVMINKGSHLGTVTKDKLDLVSKISLIFAETQ